MTNEGTRKRPAQRTGLFHSTNERRSKILVRRVGCLVDRVLGRILGITHRLLALALHFLDGAFALQAIGAGGFADALLGLADGFVGGALDLSAVLPMTFSFLR